MYSLTDLCCLCLVSSDTSRNILLQDNDGIVVQNKMEYVFSETINLKSEVSKNICIGCLNALNYVYKFKRECLQNLVTLNIYIEEMSLKTQENNKLGGIKDQLTSENHLIAQHDRPERFKTIQMKNSESSHSQKLKYAKSNAECSVPADNSQHPLRANPVLENNEEIEIIKQELEYDDDEIEIKHDPLLFDAQNSKDSFPTEPTNISDNFKVEPDSERSSADDYSNCESISIDSHHYNAYETQTNSSINTIGGGSSTNEENNPRLPRELRTKIRVAAGKTSNPTPEKKPKTLRRCHICPRSRDRKTRHTCNACNKHLCLEHAFIYCEKCVSVDSK